AQHGDVPQDVDPQNQSTWVGLLMSFLPFLIIIGIFLFLMQQMQGGGNRVMSFGKAKAKVVTKDQPKITFSDVAGVDEAVEELEEIKEFLESPSKFQQMGAKIPKGVLLFGPPGTGVILMAATNRPDILDPALLRPGRFDRQVTVDRPDLKGREAILKVHARGKPLTGDVVLDTVARRTPGFTGADLANVVNEAALLAARRGRQDITMDEMEEAIDRVIAGPQRKSRVISDKEKLIIAYHESGHALVGWALPNADPGHDVSAYPDDSDHGAAEIDSEIRRLVDEAHDEAWEILTSYREQLDRMVEVLLEKETIERHEVEEILSGVPKRSARGELISRPRRIKAPVDAAA